MKKEFYIQIFLLILVSIGVSYTYLYSDSHDFEKTIIKAEEEISIILKSFDKIIENEYLDLRSLDIYEYKDLEQKIPFDLFIYEKDKLIFWNNNNTLPEIDFISDKAQLVSLKNGYYIAIKRKKGNKTFVGLSLLRKSYSLVNNYLSNSFSDKYNFLDSDVILPALHSSGKAIKAPNGEVLFKIQRNIGSKKDLNNSKLIISILVLISLYFLFVNIIYFFNKKSYWLSVFASIILGVIWCAVIFFIPFEFKKSLLFQAELYGSKWFKSLGIIIVLLIPLLSVSFLFASFLYKRKIVLKQYQSILIYIVAVFIYVFSAVILKSLILDSIINFSIENLALFNSYSILILIISFFIAFLVILNLMIIIFLLKEQKYSVWVLITMIIGVLILAFLLGFGYYSINIVLLFSVFTFLLVYIKKLFIKGKSFFIITICIFFMLTFVSSILIPFSYVKNENIKEAIAQKKLRQRDLHAENLFLRIEKKIKKDAFVIKYFNDPLSTYSNLYKRLDFKYFGGYFSKFDLNIIPFGKKGLPLKQNTGKEIVEMESLLTLKGENTLSKNLFLIRDLYKQESYVSRLSIFDKDSFIGNLFIELIPKSSDIGNIYPELLLHKESNLIQQTELEFVFAIYKNNKLVNSNSIYDYPSNFDNLDTKKGMYKHFVLETDDGEKKVVVSLKKHKLFDMLSMFTFIMSAFILLGIVLVLIYAKFSNVQKQSIFTLSFRKKITFFMMLLGFFTFFVFGVLTIGYFSNQYNKYHKKRLVRKQKAILKSLNFTLAKNEIETEKDLSLYYQNILNNDLKKISDIHSMDMNIYNLNGEIIMSSQTDIFSTGLISRLINPSAFISLTNHKNKHFIHNEKIGNLRYASIYVPIRNHKKELISFLNIPYFSQEKNLKKDVSNFIISFLNLYALLFLISLIVAYFVSKSLTKPLQIISDKLAKISLDSKNSPISWESDDEIGTLVKEYNKMIVELEHSVNLLAKNERDEAWREMAKQIAHEIKNPLTPMKMSIQHLQRVLIEDPEGALDLTKRVTKTMIEQIDNLTDIATAFSSFAKMPVANKEEVNLIDLVDSAIDLFNRENNKLITKDYRVSTAIVSADKNQMISVFNNLVKNALQAIEENQNGNVSVSLEEKDNFYMVKIEDNGVGIPDDKKHKVFVPNFTTKSSGTGLGLAISKQIVENLKGSIWFESVENEFTIFYVKIPKV